MFSGMSSNVQTSLSNKSSAVSAKASIPSKVSALLAKLPSAAVLQQTSASAPAALARQHEFDERKSTRDDRNRRTEGLINSYADYLLESFGGKYDEANEKGYGWVTIEQAYPPSKEEIDGHLVYKHEPSETHWAGVCESGVNDPTEGGAPKVMLLQGPKPRKADAYGRRDCNPKDLPGGKTSVDILREHVADHGYGVQVAYIKGMVNVIVIWDHAGWKKSQDFHQRVRAERTAEHNQVLEEGSTQVSYADYKSAKAKPKSAQSSEGSWTATKGGR